MLERVKVPQAFTDAFANASDVVSDALENDHHLVTHWRIEGSVEEVSEILLGDPLDLPRWWPSVYQRVEEVMPGDERNVGRVIKLLSKGWLPYTLDWQFVVAEPRPGESFRIEAQGDFVGEGIWTLRQDGPYAEITYDWRIQVEKPILRQVSFLLKPVYAANHYWAMGRGEESLKLELARRRAGTAEEAERVPAPPQPSSWRAILLPLAGAAAVAAAAYGLGRALVRRS